LEKLLIHLDSQLTLNLFTYSIVVVDNDSHQSAQNVALRISSELSTRIAYWCEPRQNIAMARNRAVAKSDGKYIAFIDDDEFPESDWLLILFKTILFFDCDGIQGPVLPDYDNHCPAWAVKAGFYNRPVHANGMRLNWRQGRTGNLILKASIFNKHKCLFDESFGSGSEDQDFFRRAIERGCIFRYTREALAYEYVPPSRCHPVFLIKRALLRGKVTIGHPDFNFKQMTKSAVAIPFYGLALPILSICGFHYFIKYLVRMFDHIGKCLAVLRIKPVREIYLTQ
jgi:glycosyltransferase involved in cell wall biosynthesis